MGAVWDRRWGQIVTVRGVIVPDRLIPNSAESENNLFTNISNGSQEDRVCLNVFVPISQVWCQQPCSSCPLFADVVSELSEYWQTPGLSGMDTIYGPARVTASDLVKKWRISMQGGIKSRGTKMSVLINLHGDSKSMTKAFFFFFFAQSCLAAGCIQTGRRQKPIRSHHTPFEEPLWRKHRLQSLKCRSISCVWLGLFFSFPLFFYARYHL